MPTTDPAKKREQNRRAYARRKAREQVAAGHKQAWDAAATAAGVLPPVEAPETSQSEGMEGIEVEVQAPEASRPMSFSERMTARFKRATGQDPSTPKKPAKKGKKAEVNFLTKALPLVSGVLASYAEHLFKPQFQACAPTRAEVTAILSPIFSMMERRIEITGHMSEDAMDLMASGLALLGYTGRMYVTYVDIKRLVEGKNHAQAQAAGDRERVSAERPADGRDDPAGDLSAREAALLRSFGRGDRQAPVSGHNDDHFRDAPGDYDGLQAPDDAQVRAGHDAAYAGTDLAQQRATVAAALKQDFAYRSRNGLL